MIDVTNNGSFPVSSACRELFVRFKKVGNGLKYKARTNKPQEFGFEELSENLVNHVIFAKRFAQYEEGKNGFHIIVRMDQ